MNAFHKKLTELPELRERIGEERMDHILVSLLLLTEELNFQMDGVSCPQATSEILNALQTIHDELNVT